ncbi:MAG: hypothetical protein K0U69_15115, partial [Actinomycetia bacterium]|nr:hypothetical protein [Actinomycetes bacterium]
RDGVFTFGLHVRSSRSTVHTTAVHTTAVHTTAVHTTATQYTPAADRYRQPSPKDLISVTG